MPKTRSRFAREVSSLLRFVPAVVGLLLSNVAVAAWWGSDDGRLPEVRVAEPFAEWHSGPAAGYPVIRVSERGDSLQLVMQKTRWMKVRDEKGREGWVHLEDIGQTLDGIGQPVEISAPDREDFSGKTWEAGVMFGQFEDAAVTSVYGGYWMTENLALELWGSQVLGESSEILQANVNIVHQPFPHWRVSPFFTLGAGHAFIDPKATLAETEARSDTTAHVGLGLRVYVTDRYFVRAEVKDYKVFTDRATNEEATEWKVGLSVFF
ncbi:outer membrane beta-barrel protein [Marinobacter sp.]|uniref:outer membrane beta-barrel protein n=1 Tax=Marinobacter sp. TaxID=50741 RepID=UPI00384CC15C